MWISFSVYWDLYKVLLLSGKTSSQSCSVYKNLRTVLLCSIRWECTVLKGIRARVLGSGPPQHQRVALVVIVQIQWLCQDVEGSRGPRLPEFLNVPDKNFWCCPEGMQLKSVVRHCYIYALDWALLRASIVYKLGSYPATGVKSPRKGMSFFS